MAARGRHAMAPEAWHGGRGSAAYKATIEQNSDGAWAYGVMWQSSSVVKGVRVFYWHVSLHGRARTLWGATRAVKRRIREHVNKPASSGRVIYFDKNGEEL